MLWLFFALLESVLHGLANVLDNYFVNRVFNKPSALVFFSSLTDLLFIPLVILIQVPQMPTLEILPVLIFLGFTGIAYLYPYYKALESADSSVVVSLFSLNRIFVPVLAFFLVGERLTLMQYLGFFIIVFGGTALSFGNVRRLKLNGAFWWMILCSLILALEAVGYKYVFESFSWSTGLVWSSVFSFMIAMSLFLSKDVRATILDKFSDYRKNFHLFTFEEFLTFAGEASFLYALSIAPVTLVKGIGSFQPFFVLIYAILFSKMFPKIFKEKIDYRSVGKKFFFFAVMLVGVYLAAT